MWYALYLLGHEHEFEQALEMLDRALELDPLQFSIYAFRGSWAYCFIPQFDAVIGEAKKVLSLDPGYAYGPHMLGEACVGQGRYEDAIANYEEAIRRMGRATTNVAELGYAHAVAGNTNEAMDLLREMEERAYRSDMYHAWVALIYVGLGENEKALEWFEKACETHDLSLLWLASLQWPKLVDFRKDPQFKKLMKRAGLAHLVQ
jgi:tetratricopeptide (TPR) repeat protein